jgi:hypothetical protein
MHLEYLLCQIYPNLRNIHLGLFLPFGWRFALPVWHIDAV